MIFIFMLTAMSLTSNACFLAYELFLFHLNIVLFGFAFWGNVLFIGFAFVGHMLSLGVGSLIVSLTDCYKSVILSLPLAGKLGLLSSYFGSLKVTILLAPVFFLSNFAH